MNLQDYLDAIKKCPDSMLRKELGIGNEFSIFLKADYDNVLNYLEPDYSALVCFSNSDSKITRLINNKGRLIDLDVCNWILHHIALEALSTELGRHQAIQHA